LFKRAVVLAATYVRVEISAKLVCQTWLAKVAHVRVFGERRSTTVLLPREFALGVSKSASVALPAAPTAGKAAHFRLEEARRHAQLPLTVSKAAVRGVASAGLEELAAHASAIQVGLLPDLGRAVGKLARRPFATFVGEEEFAHLCLHELADMLLP
jgi:hypothetical protein